MEQIRPHQKLLPMKKRHTLGQPHQLRKQQEHRKGCVKFDPPLDAKCVSIDGTSSAKCLVIDASEIGAQLRFPDGLPGLGEFFLIFTASPKPVFRRCNRVWINGNRMGVEYQRTPSYFLQ
jgi:hypothetical protein